MLIYGYAKDYYYADDGTMRVRVRVPQIHGAYKQTFYDGSKVRNYVLDGDLPYYTSMLLPREPHEGDVVVLACEDNNNLNGELMVIGLTGATVHTQD